MAVKSEDVRAGKCFTSGVDDGVRRVLRVSDGLVTYEARHVGRFAITWSTAAIEAVDAFVGNASAEVGADYVPNRAAEFIYT